LGFGACDLGFSLRAAVSRMPVNDPFHLRRVVPLSVISEEHYFQSFHSSRATYADVGCRGKPFAKDSVGQKSRRSWRSYVGDWTNQERI